MKTPGSSRASRGLVALCAGRTWLNLLSPLRRARPGVVFNDSLHLMNGTIKLAVVVNCLTALELGCMFYYLMSA